MTGVQTCALPICTAIGVGGGAAVGAGVGALAGNTALGAVIGAAVGGTAGALIGKKMDKQKKELEATLPEDTKIESVNNGEALKVTFDSGILFATNSSTLSDASKSALRNFATSLKANPDTDIRIIGFTDNTGKVDYNQTLSEKRAKSVYDYLMMQGVSTDRMVYEGKGIHDPVASNASGVPFCFTALLSAHAYICKMYSDSARSASCNQYRSVCLQNLCCALISLLSFQYSS